MQEAERQLLVVAGSPHRHRERPAIDADLERLLDGDLIGPAVVDDAPMHSGVEDRWVHAANLARTDNAAVSEPDRADREAAILELARRVPEGFVTTYGDLSPNAPRHAGAVLARCEDPSVPWHRIVRADGSLAQGARQRKLLAAEGVPIRCGRVEMESAYLPRIALIER